jgi:predicted ATPase/DNA-binding CsgD family transcriptional regulator
MQAGWDSVAPDQIDSLNTREIEILGMMAKGLSNSQVAARLNLSKDTIKWYNKRIFLKLGVGSRTQAIAKAFDSGLLETQPKTQSALAPRPLHNLPAPITSFVGREKEIEEIGQLLTSQRLLVLTGAGGSGKTRLALQVGRNQLGKFRDGLWLVELAALVDPGLVVQAVAQVFGLSSNADETLTTVVKRYLSRKQLLLILDNFEHLLEAAPLIGEILAAAPQVTILVTSRERLHIYGELEYPVFPLSLPDTSRKETLQQIISYDSLKLFLQRAQAVRPNLRLNETQARAAAQICIRLDGLPLALELAATQAKVYSFPQLADLLKANLASLPPGPRDAPARQRTLRATIEWSYSLLSPSEKALFARLAIFTGGGTLEAVEAICAGANPDHVREDLASLVDKNMTVPREGQDGELHFTLLETIRAFALECLKDSGEMDWLRQAHAAYFANLAELSSVEIRGVKQVYWFARLRTERENIRSILQWSLAGSEPDTDATPGLRLVSALTYFWFYDAQFLEDARCWTELALQKSTGASAQISAGIKILAGSLDTVFGDRLRGRVLLREAYAIYNRIHDEAQAALALVYLSGGYIGSSAEARQGLAPCNEGLAYFRKVNDKHGISEALNALGELSFSIGDYASAKNYYEECLQISEETGERLRVAIQYSNLSITAYHQNQPPDDIEKLAIKAIRVFQEVDSANGILGTFPKLATAAILSGNPERAARLLGACQKLLEEIGSRFQNDGQSDFDHLIVEIKRSLGEDGCQAESAKGAAMTYAQALNYALGQE